jgi:glycosyltransferase involved in cell wall biosynthesis
MRILHVTSGKIYGGIDTALVSMAKYRATCPTLDQHFAYCFPGRFESELRDTGASAFYIGPVRSSRLWTVARSRQYFRALLEKYDYDAVICHSPWAMIVLGSLVRCSKARLIYWVHNFPMRQEPLFSFLGICERWAKQIRPDLVVCNSHFTRSYVNDIYPGVTSQVIYYPVEAYACDRVRRDEVRQKLGADKRTTVIIQVSRMQRWKGHLFHIEALAQLKHIPGWQCWIVGGVQEKGEAQHLSRLKKLVNKRGIGERVRFLGQRKDVHQLLAAADIFCQPNVHPEPFGIVYIEALHSGLPVVATDLGGAHEIVTPHCGLLVPREDVHALSGTLGRLIEDVPFRNMLGRHAAMRARELCAPEERIGDLYQLLHRTCLSA